MAIKLKKLFLLAPLFVSLVSCGNKEPEKGGNKQEEETRIMHNHSVYDSGLEFNDSLWTAPDFNYDSELDNQGCKGLFIRSDHNDNESYAFAYLGIPDHKEGEKLPAILLLHGGGGTAYYEWVNVWKEKGFVALAVDLEGHIPNKEGRITDGPTELYHASKYSAPHNSNLGDGNDDLSKTWLHYACRTAIIANSFLHNLDCVDTFKIGITGISWGGFITSIISGYDDRFAFSMPIYCTVMCEESGTPIGSYIKNDKRFELFDKVEPLSKVNTPIKLIVSDKDTHCNVLYASDVIKTTKNGNFAIISNLLHSHAHAYNLPETFAFALDVLEKKSGIFTTYDGDSLLVSLPEGKEIKAAWFFNTTDESINNSTSWRNKEISSDKILNTEIKFSMKDEITFYYVSFLDERGATFSSFIKEK